MKKIMFNDKYSLTQAVLDGRKTTTRRIVTDKKLHYWKCSCPDMVIVRVPESQKLKTDDDNTYFGIKDKISSEYYCDTITSPYKVDEVVAIAQRYKDVVGKRDEAQETLCLYKIGEKYLTMEEMGAGWNNKLFVRADLMPHHIRITDIKVERLQNISDEDCLKEGIYKGQCGSADTHFMDAYYYKGDIQPYCTPRGSFAALIDKVSGKGTWLKNPYVFCYSFKLID
ncbi:hypothetical protein ACJEEN_12165 [Bacteroides clarus]|uniref:hypothetical protein n=1 Tax=Bacteroides clarus TaxID=626929 RepID=UPI00397DA537